MKIELDTAASDSHKIISYSDDSFQLENRIIHSNLVITKHQIIENWLAEGYSYLKIEHLDPIISWQPEVILLGTGKRLHFPNRALIAHVIKKNIGFEVMDTGAACRSYNLLINEGRKVVACLLLPKLVLNKG